MALELILKSKFVSGSVIKLNVDISCHSQCLVIGGKGMVSDWVVEQMMYFGSRHGCYEGLGLTIGVALHYRCRLQVKNGRGEYCGGHLGKTIGLSVGLGREQTNSPIEDNINITQIPSAVPLIASQTQSVYLDHHGSSKLLK